MNITSMTHQERGDIMFNFAYLMDCGSKLTFKAFASLIKLSNVSPQALELVEYLEATEGTISRDVFGHSITI